MNIQASRAEIDSFLKDESQIHSNYIKNAQAVIRSEKDSLDLLAQNIPGDFTKLVDKILHLEGKVALLGMGKSGHIAKKMAASLSSTGTSAFFIHPGEASHGDLGMLTQKDLVIMLSNSGETTELFDTINYCKRFNIEIAAITMVEGSTLAKSADYLLLLPKSKEVSDINAPTNSIIMMLSLGDALFVVLHRARGFTAEQFKNFHPGGKIGSSLLKVKDLMYMYENLPIINLNTNFYDMIVEMTSKTMGCVLVVGDNRELLGIITDGDLRRHIADSDLYKKEAIDIMTSNPISISKDHFASEALRIMNENSVTVLPVIENQNLLGILHIHEILRSGVK